MPYIKQSHRDLYENELSQLANKVLEVLTKEKDGISLRAGHLNYIVTMLLKKIYPEKCRYSDYNEQVGVLESAKLELYRRRISKYENEKIDSEGDVY